MRCPCPECGSSDGGWIYPDGRGNAYCFVCHHSWWVEVDKEKPMPAQKTNPLIPNIEYRPLSKRRVSEETCRLFGYGWDGDSQVALYRDSDRTVIAAKTRTRDKKFSVTGRGKNLPLFGQWLWPDKGRKIVVTEGEIDALTVSEIQGNRWPVVSLPNGAGNAAQVFANQLEFLEGYDEVVLMFDQDEPGQAAAVEAAQVLSPGKAKIATLPLKDPSEMRQANRSKEVVTAIWNAATWRPQGILAGADLWSEVSSYSAKPVVPYHHSGLNVKLGGMRGGEIVVVCAGTGIGKSTFCRELAADLMSRDHTVGYVALEGGLRANFLGLMTPLVARPLLSAEGNALEDEDVKEAFQQVGEKLVLFNPRDARDADNIIARMRYMIVALGCKQLVLDNLSVVVASEGKEDERKFIDNLLIKLDELVQRHDVTLLLVCHLKRPQDGRGHEEGRQVKLSDLRSSGMIEKLCTDAIAIERDQQADDGSEDIGLVRVLKNRNGGSTGPAGHVRYDTKTGRQLEHVATYGDGDDEY